MGLFENLLLPFGTITLNGWVKWYHSGVPDKEGQEREKAKKRALLNRHCKICCTLSGCYFIAKNMPKYPQHTHCDCLLFSISKPTLQAEASCALEKFTGYIFNAENNNGKTQLFESWGFTIEDSGYLKSEFENQARRKYLSGEYTLNSLNEYGQRITISIELKTINKFVTIKTGWVVHPLGLITCATPFSGEIK